MIIGLPDGQEIGLKWAGRVGTWQIALPGRETLWQGCNDAGLSWYIEKTQEKKDSHARVRCVRGYPWQCPYLKEGNACPCTSRYKTDQKELAVIETSNWERRQGFKRDGHQLTLEYGGYWHNTKTGEERWNNEARPYAFADLVCKQFSVASMEWLKRVQGWSPLRWRIQPADNDMNWINQMQLDHSGKYKQCIFDIWD